MKSKNNLELNPKKSRRKKWGRHKNFSPRTPKNLNGLNNQLEADCYLRGAADHTGGRDGISSAKKDLGGGREGIKFSNYSG